MRATLPIFTIYGDNNAPPSFSASPGPNDEKRWIQLNHAARRNRVASIRRTREHRVR